MTSRHVCRTLASGLLVLVIAPGVAHAQTFNLTPVVTEARTTVAPSPVKVSAPVDFRWTGVYFGGTAGYGNGTGDTTFVLMPSGQGGVVPDAVHPDQTGWAYGFYGGVNGQGGRFVAGAEVDIMFSNMDGSQQLTNFTFAGATIQGTMSAAQSIDWYSTVRGRAGVDIAGYLLYGTAGFATERLNHASNITTPVQYPVDQTDTKYGWTVGFGMEAAVNRHTTWRAQYLHLDVGSTTANATPVQGSSPFTVDHTWISTSNVFSAGIGFKF